MQQRSNQDSTSRIFAYLEIAIIVLIAIIPLFLTFPYRVNIFLSWEGAYRISEGQVPYRDFGMPLGYMYWVIPAIFFKIFGAQLITLVKAQVFINIISGLAFRSILKSLDLPPGVRLLSVLLYVISYSFFNFWPWYNHTVIVYQMVGLAFLMRYLLRYGKAHWILLPLSALFTFFSFFTKQDGGALALLICLALLAYTGISQKRWKPLLIFVFSYGIAAFAIIAPLTRFNFGYWFNMGQAPHTARVSTTDILNDFLYSSQFIKIYLFLIVVVCLVHYKQWKQLLTDFRTTLFLLLTLGILAEATILQVTSYTPPDNNIFFHSFAIAFILFLLTQLLQLDLSRMKFFVPIAMSLVLIWSGVFWNYIQRILHRAAPAAQQQAPASTENVVNRSTYMITPPTKEIPPSDWTFTGLKSFEKVYMPRQTVEGIQRLMQSPVVKNKSNLRVLNLTELTPLAVELPYASEKGPDVPLWHHLGVAMFNRDAARYEKKIATGQYDLALFEHIPNLNNFFPFRIRDSLYLHYQKIDSFPAPRRGETQGLIEVFIKR